MMRQSVKIVSKFCCLFLVFATTGSVFAQKKKVIYEYKKYEKFDFDALAVSGKTGNPGDISISQRFAKKFQNKLPARRNFNKEIKRSIQRIR